MCGVIGYFPREPDELTPTRMLALVTESAVRGVHAFGIAQAHGGMIDCWKSVGPDPRGAFLEADFDPEAPAVAHWRYSTSGDWRQSVNNQPILAAGRALAFNGVIHMGTKTEFEREFDVTCDSENDGEVFLRRLQRGDDPVQFVSEMRGSFAGVWLATDGRLRALRNNRRPLWRAEAKDGIWYASTRDIFARAGFLGCAEVRPFEIMEES